MAKIYYEKDVNKDYLKGKTVAVIGYGSQGRAQALNLNDSGIDVIVGLYEGSKSIELVKEDGLKVTSVAEAAKKADIVQILIPDELQSRVYSKDGIKENLQEGNVLMFSHGFSIHFGQITPPENIDVIMVAPKSPGQMLRQVYTEGKGVPNLC